MITEGSKLKKETSKRNGLIRRDSGLWVPEDWDRQPALYEARLKDEHRHFQVKTDLSLVAPTNYNEFHKLIKTWNNAKEEYDVLEFEERVINKSSETPEAGEVLDEILETHFKEEDADKIEYTTQRLIELTTEVQTQINQGESYRVQFVNSLLEKTMPEGYKLAFSKVNSEEGTKYKQVHESKDPKNPIRSILSDPKTVRSLCRKVNTHDNLTHKKLYEDEARGKKLVYWADISNGIKYAPIADLYRARALVRDYEALEVMQDFIENEFDILWLKDYTKDPKKTGFGKHGAAHYVLKQKKVSEEAPVIELHLWTEKTAAAASEDSYYRRRLAKKN